MLHFTLRIDAKFALQHRNHANALWLVQISNITEIAPDSLMQESFVLEHVLERKRPVMQKLNKYEKAMLIYTVYSENANIKTMLYPIQSRYVV